MNTENQLKSKLAWCENGTGAINRWNEVLLGITWFLLCRGRGIKSCWEAVESTKEFFYAGVEWVNFWLAGELCLSPSPVVKTMQNFLLTT